MGRVWRFTMVLLSTLAALVIIVHSAEEDYEAQYRRELRPRMLDTGTPRTYEQPWRTMEVEPVKHHSTPEETWLEMSSDEPPRRIRSGRKRKRRPEPSKDLVPIEGYGYAEESVRPFIDVDSSPDRKTSDTSKRRRKKLEARPERWDAPVEEDRPVRRRGQRRKRPSLEAWPIFSEFNDYRPNASPRQIEHATTGPINAADAFEDYRQFDDRDNIQTRFIEPQTFDTTHKHITQPIVEETEIKSTGPKDETFVKDTDDRKHEDNRYSQKNFKGGASLILPDVIHDKSLSEFSNEDLSSVRTENIENDRTMSSKVRDKSTMYFKEHDKSTANRPIDPLTLKDILKRSNGTSLSEILQQHNLSLSDLLHGKEHVISIFKSEDSLALTDVTENKPFVENSKEENESSEEKILLNSETKYVLDPISENLTTTRTTQDVDVEVTTDLDLELTTAETPKAEKAPKRPNIRRFPTAMRRKQRIRPMMNTTYKSQVSRDMIALNARKYFSNRRRNSTQEWKDLIPMLKKNISNEYVSKKIEIETTTISEIEATTMLQDFENCTRSAESESGQNNTSENLDDIAVNIYRQNKTETVTDVNIVQPSVNVTDRPILHLITTQALNASGLRRQAFNNRLKKKRLKQKNLTTEPPQDDIMRNLFGIPNLVSSSEFIAQTQGLKTSLDDVIILEDFMTTEMPHKETNRAKTTKYSSTRTATTPQFVYIPSSTEETAKIEIEEMFNDTQTNARLSKILKERNMTLSELFEHRERGSSHIHLADVFHNASKEPNPPEPFLSKSLIEPISKEIYPLRALLDANNHDPTAKATTVEPVTVAGQTTEVNIPVIMNFGNNVNENAENMGIMSLFHNIKQNGTAVDTTTLKKDSQGTLYETSITVVNTTDVRNGNDTIRESRVIHVIDDNQDDVVSWNEIFSLMRSTYELKNTTANGLIPAEKIQKQTLEKDLDGDGLIVLEDIQNVKEFDSNIASASNENLNFDTFEKAEIPKTQTPGVLGKIPNQTKSVTVVTACIAGLAIVLFLLTYVGYRWQHQRTMSRKKSFQDEHVPSPVFENRKGHKNNSSNRSISPMLTSNIYTLNTLDSRHGKESPDYMWDSLRKPFQ